MSIGVDTHKKQHVLVALRALKRSLIRAIWRLWPRCAPAADSVALTPAA